MNTSRQHSMQQLERKLGNEEDFCPFTKFPCSDCYCMNIDSGHIGDMTEFCIGRYLECPLFASNLKNHRWPERLT